MYIIYTDEYLALLKGTQLSLEIHDTKIDNIHTQAFETHLVP